MIESVVENGRMYSMKLRYIRKLFVFVGRNHIIYHYTECFNVVVTALFFGVLNIAFALLVQLVGAGIVQVKISTTLFVAPLGRPVIKY